MDLKKKQLIKDAMIRFPVNATNIVSIGYDEISKILEIEFKIKVVHQYHNVSFSTYIYLITSENIEDYYFSKIISKYQFEVL